MIKSLIFSIMLIFICLNEISAQTLATDSIKKVALKDAKKFKLNSHEVKQVKKGNITNQSDLFKPTAESTKNIALLTDSTYVKTYRAAAYQRVLKSRTSAHHLILGIEITAGLLLAVSMIAFGAASK